MPISRKQLDANRANAQKSMGPRTSFGKRAASQNAVSHGLYARDTVINSPYLKESQCEYDELLQGLLDEFQPEGAFQSQLVHTIANCLWRQRRAINAETAHLNSELESQAEHYHLFEDSAADERGQKTLSGASEPDVRPRLSRLETLAASRSIPTGNFCLALLRYEMRVDVRLARAYKLLRSLQWKNPESEQTPPLKKGNYILDKPKGGVVC